MRCRQQLVANGGFAERGREDSQSGCLAVLGWKERAQSLTAGEGGVVKLLALDWRLRGWAKEDMVVGLEEGGVLGTKGVFV